MKLNKKKNIKVFFINLKNRTDRLRFIKKQLKINKLRGYRISGIDADLINRKIIKEHELHLSPSGIAGCLVHKKIWEKIVKKKINFSLILEDDAIISSRLKIFLKKIESILIENNIDIINVNTHELPTKIGKAKYHIKEIATTLHEMVTAEYGTAGYIISYQCAKKLLLDESFGTLPIDLYLFSKKTKINKKLKILQTFPALTIPLASVNNLNQNKILYIFKNKREFYKTAMTSADYNNYKNKNKIIIFTYNLMNYVKKIFNIRSLQFGKIYFHLKHFFNVFINNKKLKILINRFEI